MPANWPWGLSATSIRPASVCSRSSAGTGWWMTWPPDDFETLRAQIAKTYGKLSRKVEIKRVRSIFRYAYEANLIDKPVRFGPGFVGPSRRELRCERQQNGQRMFEAAEIRAMLAAAPVAFESHDPVGHQLRLRQYRRGESHRQEPGPERRLVQLPEAQDRDLATLPTLAGDGQGDQGSVGRAAGSLRTKPMPIWYSSRPAGSDGCGRGETRRTSTRQTWKARARVPCGPGDGRHGAVAQQARACPPGPHILCPTAHL